jgi:modulator of FtsH protease
MNKVKIAHSLQGDAAVEINSVLRNTYLLLSLTLIFSALVAWFTIEHSLPMLNIFLAIVLMYGLLFLTSKLRNSPFGLVAVFAFTGFLGYITGTYLTQVLIQYTNATKIITTAFGSTAAIFLGLSFYAITTRKNYSYMGGFICAGSLIVVGLMVASFFFNFTFLDLIVCGGFCLISSAYILYTTSSIIHGGERNYITATVSLYISLYNIFISLIRIYSYVAGNKR